MKTKPWYYHNKPTGFSLIETLAYMAIGTIVLTAAVGFMIESGRLQSFIAEQSQAVSIADKASNLLAKVLRETTDGDDGAYALAETSAYGITFYSDIDADAVTERIQYSLSGTNFVQTITEPTGSPAQYLPINSNTKTVATYIVNQTFSQYPIFQYYDASNQLLSAPVNVSDVMLVRLHFDVNVNPNRVPDTHALDTYVQLRNLNANL